MNAFESMFAPTVRLDAGSNTALREVRGDIWGILLYVGRRVGGPPEGGNQYVGRF